MLKSKKKPNEDVITDFRQEKQEKERLKSNKYIRNTDVPFFVNADKKDDYEISSMFPKLVKDKGKGKISDCLMVNKEPEYIDVRWKGNNSLCCKGKIYISPNYYYGLITALYITVYSSFFIIFILGVR